MTRSYLLIPLIAAAGFAMAGCASDNAKQPDPQYTQVIVRPMPSVTADPARVNVQWVDLNQHSVAIRINGYRHTVSSDTAYLPPATVAASRHSRHTQRSTDTPQTVESKGSSEDPAKAAETSKPSEASESTDSAETSDITEAVVDEDAMTVVVAPTIGHATPYDPPNPIVEISKR